MKKIKYLIVVLALFLVSGINVNAASKTVSEGTYSIATAINNKSILDIASEKIKNKANIQLYADNYIDIQQWKLVYLNNGYYKIVSAANTNYALDVVGNKKKNGTNVQLYKYNGSKAQQWEIKSAGSGYYYIISRGTGLYLDVKGGKSANKTNIQIYKGNKSKSQKFIFSPIVKGTKTIENGEYIISSVKNDNYVIDLNSGKVQNNGNIQLYKYNTSDAQHWYIEYLNNGYYKITSLKDYNYALDVNGGLKNNGTNLQLYKSNNSNAQQWIIKDVGNGLYNIISKVNGLAIDITGGKVANSTNLQLYTNSKTNASQQFTFTPVEYVETPEIEYGFLGGDDKQSGFKVDIITEEKVDGYEVNSYSMADDSKTNHGNVKSFNVTIPNGSSIEIEARAYKIVKGAKVYSIYNCINIDNYYGISVESAVEDLENGKKQFNFKINSDIENAIKEGFSYGLNVYKYNEENECYDYEEYVDNSLEYSVIYDEDLIYNDCPKYKFDIDLYNEETKEVRYSNKSKEVYILNNLKISTLNLDYIAGNISDSLVYCKINIDGYESNNRNGYEVYVSNDNGATFIQTTSLEITSIDMIGKIYKARQFEVIGGVKYYGLYSDELTISNSLETPNIYRKQNTSIYVDSIQNRNFDGFELYTKNGDEYNLVNETIASKNYEYWAVFTIFDDNKNSVYCVRTYRDVNGKRIYSDFSNDIEVDFVRHSKLLINYSDDAVIQGDEVKVTLDTIIGDIDVCNLPNSYLKIYSGNKYIKTINKNQLDDNCDWANFTTTLQPNIYRKKDNNDIQVWFYDENNNVTCIDVMYDHTVDLRFPVVTSFGDYSVSDNKYKITFTGFMQNTIDSDDEVIVYTSDTKEGNYKNIGEYSFELNNGICTLDLPVNNKISNYLKLRFKGIRYSVLSESFEVANLGTSDISWQMTGGNDDGYVFGKIKVESEDNFDGYEVYSSSDLNGEYCLVEDYNNILIDYNSEFYYKSRGYKTINNIKYYGQYTETIFISYNEINQENRDFTDKLSLSKSGIDDSSFKIISFYIEGKPALGEIYESKTLPEGYTLNIYEATVSNYIYSYSIYDEPIESFSSGDYTESIRLDDIPIVIELVTPSGERNFAFYIS